MAVIGNSYYTLDEAAQALGIHYLTLWRRIRRYNIPTVRAGWSVLVKLEDVRAVTSALPAVKCDRVVQQATTTARK